jgi:hypothetical protein
VFNPPSAADLLKASEREQTTLYMRDNNQHMRATMQKQEIIRESNFGCLCCECFQLNFLSFV